MFVLTFVFWIFFIPQKPLTLIFKSDKLGKRINSYAEPRYISHQAFLAFFVTSTGWKVSVFGVILVRIYPHLDWIPRDTPYLSVFSPNAGQIRTTITPNTDTFNTVKRNGLLQEFDLHNLMLIHCQLHLFANTLKY